MNWAALSMAALPALQYLHHIPNGGRRNVIEAQRMKREGVKAGVPDYQLPYRVGDRAGVVFEIKSSTGRLTSEQRWWLQHYADQGWLSFMAFDWVTASRILTAYLRSEPIVIAQPHIEFC
jgi:hypothetical protein